MDEIKEEAKKARVQLEAVKAQYKIASESKDPFLIKMAQQEWESAMKVLEGAEESLAAAYKTRTVNLPPRHPQPMDESRVREIVASQLRWAPTRARRDMSVNSMSDAWNLMMSEQRVELSQAFFFPLKTLPNGFSTTAFQEEAYTDKDDENKLHHRYFLKHAGLLVEDAMKYGATIRQQLRWTFKGKWLTLDDSPANGKEPDFSMMQYQEGATFVTSNEAAGATPPYSKYEVSVAFEQKKAFTASETMEAVDYGERLLCVQREREFAITAHFHCNGNQKIIRWVRVEVGNDGKYRAKVSRPASLTPGGEGQRQLLTLLMMSSEEIGLRLPSVQPFDQVTTFEIHSWLGRGATSKVYRANWNGQNGVVKVLEPVFVGCVDREVNVLAKLIAVPGVPRCRKIATNAIFFDDVLWPMLSCPESSVQQLVTCLEQTHAGGVVHRDIRPENVMCVSNTTILNDWGCAAAVGTPVSFAGTFRYASNEVLNAASTNVKRAPQPKDDLHSLVRTVLAMNDVEIREKLSSINDRDFGAVSSFWEEWQKRHPLSGACFAAAENLDYGALLQLR